MSGDEVEQRIAQARLDAVRKHRVWAERDRSLGFLPDVVKREIDKPFKQLQRLAPLWEELVPGELLEQTRLDRLSRGVLHVTVQGSAHLYELDRLLRGGVERELVTRHKGPAFRRVKLELGVVGAGDG